MYLKIINNCIKILPIKILLQHLYLNCACQFEELKRTRNLTVVGAGSRGRKEEYSQGQETATRTAQRRGPGPGNVSTLWRSPLWHFLIILPHIRVSVFFPDISINPKLSSNLILHGWPQSIGNEDHKAADLSLHYPSNFRPPLNWRQLSFKGTFPQNSGPTRATSSNMLLSKQPLWC